MHPTDSSAPHLAQPSPEAKRMTLSPLGIMLLAAIMALMGVVLVSRFGQLEEEREMLRWQNRLGLIADSRAADVDAWLGRHMAELTDVAANPSLKLYFTALMSKDKSPAAAMEEPAQLVYLRNLLIMTSERMGFAARQSDDVKAIRANVGKPSGTGLALLGREGELLVSTQSLGAPDEALLEKLRSAPLGKASLIELPAEAGRTRLAFVLPIYPIQGDATAGQQIGKLVGVKDAGDELSRLLVQPGVTDKTLEAVLLRREGENIVYLASPPAGAQEEQGKSLQFAASTEGLDAAHAIAQPGDFGLWQNHNAAPVLMTSRALTGAPWVLMLHIDRDEALAESDGWRRTMASVMALALLALVASIVAAWWYGASRRAMLLSLQTSRLAAHSVAQERLLRLVADNQHEAVYITDAQHVVRFANERAAERFHIKAQDALGKDLPALVGPAAAKDYTEASAAALSLGRPVSRTHSFEEEGRQHTMHTDHIPLAHIPVNGLPEPSPGVLVVDQDVTQIVAERERRERTLSTLVGTLVRMVDARDPFAANHSAAVALVAREISHGMGLEPVLAGTAEIAGKLMNIGKIVVPSEILTKRSALAQDEMQAVRDSFSRSVALLQGIEFDGPVVDTLRQAAERVDGSGPLKLKGDAILVTARVIAVANALVGMVSPRAWRSPISFEQATAELLQNIDTQFDRRVVVAAVNFLENKHGREALGRLMGKKAA